MRPYNVCSKIQEIFYQTGLSCPPLSSPLWSTGEKASRIMTPEEWTNELRRLQQKLDFWGGGGEEQVVQTLIHHEQPGPPHQHTQAKQESVFSKRQRDVRYLSKRFRIYFLPRPLHLLIVPCSLADIVLMVKKTIPDSAQFDSLLHICFGCLL